LRMLTNVSLQPFIIAITNSLEMLTDESPAIPNCGHKYSTLYKLHTSTIYCISPMFSHSAHKYIENVHR
jgi:hypothetical protein